MKYFLTVIACLFFHPAFSKEDGFQYRYDTLLQHIAAENWTASEKMSKEMLTYAETHLDMESEQEMLRYIYIYSVAGMMNDKKLTKDAALQKVKGFKGKKIKMPGHPFGQQCPANCTHLTDDKDTFFSIVNNEKATQIFSFEYVKIKDGIKETADQLEGKFISLRGTLEEISVEGNMLPRFRLNVIDGGYVVME